MIFLRSELILRVRNSNERGCPSGKNRCLSLWGGSTLFVLLLSAFIAGRHGHDLEAPTGQQTSPDRALW